MLHVLTYRVKDRHENIEDYGVLAVAAHVDLLREVIPTDAENRGADKTKITWPMGEHGVSVENWGAELPKGLRLHYTIAPIQLLTDGPFMHMCREDMKPDGNKGRQHLFTKQFPSLEAAYEYASTVSFSREPHAVIAIPVREEDSRTG